eukprot:4334483-Karenia_brevis.AAC.1
MAIWAERARSSKISMSEPLFLADLALSAAAEGRDDTTRTCMRLCSSTAQLGSQQSCVCLRPSMDQMISQQS